MERVQFQQEQMLAELKDLVEKGIFAHKEVKQIMKKRTIFETALVRRVAKKNDYLRYIAYEMDLEALRKKRVERLKTTDTMPSISDYALVRRQFHIFERALKKFKSDVGLWIQYIELAKKEGARSLVGRISARALQLHPNVPALYIIAASHELSHLSPSAARTLLQRGIRLNADSVEMWREYTRMELGFVESMRRRWDVLGINVNGKGKERETMDVDDEDGLNEGEVERIQTDAAGEGDGAEQARKEIMQGAIVKSVLTNAANALPKAELFTSIHDLLATYPTSTELRTSLLDHLHTLLRKTLPTDPIAVRLSATWQLVPSLDGAALIDELKRANECLISAVNESASSLNRDDRDGMSKAYASFVADWVNNASLDPSLKAYLLTSLHALITNLSKQPSSSVPAPLLATHVQLLTANPALHPHLPYAQNILKIAKRYTSSKYGQTNAAVWIARLEAEKAFWSPDELDGRISSTAREARAVVCNEGAIDVWRWGLSVDAVTNEEQAGQQLETISVLLRESMHMQDAPSFRAIHDSLLSHAVGLIKRYSEPKTRLMVFRRVTQATLPDASTFKAAFVSETSLSPADQSEDLLKEIYNAWRRRDVVTASLTWAQWLLTKGRGEEARSVIQRAVAEVGDQAQRLNDGWRRVLDTLEPVPVAQAQDNSDEEMQDDA